MRTCIRTLFVISALIVSTSSLANGPATEKTLKAISDYLGVNISGQVFNEANLKKPQVPLTPATPGMAQTKIIAPNLWRYNNFTNNSTLVLTDVAPYFDKKLDQQPAAPTLTLQAIQNFLTTASDCDTAALCAVKIANIYANELGISSRPYKKSTGTGFNNQNPTDSNPFNNQLNFEMLIGPAMYDPSIAPSAIAINVVRFLSGMAVPRPIPPNASGVDILQMRTRVARASVGISNLFQLFSKRIPLDGIGKVMKLRMAGRDVDKASLQLLENFQANRRVSAKHWYEQMEKAPQITLNREMLYVMAEIESQLYRLQQTQEKVLATLSVMQLQSLDQLGH